MNVSALTAVDMIVALCVVLVVAGGVIAWRSKRAPRIDRTDVAHAGLPSDRERANAPGSGADVISRPSPEMPAVPVRPSRLVLGDLTAPELVIERYLASAGRTLVEIPVDAQLGAKLAPFLQHAPSLALSTLAAASSNLYALTFSPAVTQGLSAGTYDLARSAEGGYRAFALGDTGIVEHGSLIRPSALEAAALAVAVWQVLSIIVAQQHLATISTRLQRLSAEVAEILHWLESSRWGRLSGKAAYLRQLFPRLQGNMATREDALTIRTQLEMVERETLEDLHAIDAELASVVGSIADSPVKKRWWGTSEDAATIAKRIERLDGLLKQRHLAIHTRGIAAQLLACFPGCESIARQRVADIEHDFRNELHFEAGRQNLAALIDERIQSRMKTTAATTNREKLTSDLDAVERGIAQQSQQIGCDLDDLKIILDLQIRQQQEGLRLVAERNSDGGVAKLYRIT